MGPRTRELRGWEHALESGEAKLLSLEEALEKFGDFLKLKLDSIELDQHDSEEALAWAVRNEATYYDSVYVKASKKTGAILLTADNMLYNKASKEVPTLHLRNL